MASGMELMLKTFGFDPKEIVGKVEQMGQLVLQMATDQKAIREQNDEILKLLKRNIENDERKISEAD